MTITASTSHLRDPLLGVLRRTVVCGQHQLSRNVHQPTQFFCTNELEGTYDILTFPTDTVTFLTSSQVSFLGYFAGCVDHNNMPVVSGDSKDEATGWRPLFRPGPEPVRARVLLVDYVNKAIRLTLRPHLVGMRAPSGLPPTGALLEGEVVRVDPALGLLLRVRKLKSSARVAFQPGSTSFSLSVESEPTS